MRENIIWRIRNVASAFSVNTVNSKITFLYLYHWIFFLVTTQQVITPNQRIPLCIRIANVSQLITKRIRRCDL